jgi:hypothetical protein
MSDFIHHDFNSKDFLVNILVNNLQAQSLTIGLPVLNAHSLTVGLPVLGVPVLATVKIKYNLQALGLTIGSPGLINV